MYKRLQRHQGIFTGNVQYKATQGKVIQGKANATFVMGTCLTGLGQIAQGVATGQGALATPQQNLERKPVIPTPKALVALV
eukprot:2057469-Amphidinium_carterae.2